MFRQTKLTQHGTQKLSEELSRLKNVLSQLRMRITESVHAGESEDASFLLTEYRAMQDRLHNIENVLRNATKHRLSRPGKVIGIGSHVYLKRKNSLVEAILVDPVEADPLNGYIPIDSPLGQSIIGKHANQTIKVQTPRGKEEYLILKVE